MLDTGSEVLFKPVKEPAPTLIQSAFEARAILPASAAATPVSTPDPSADLRRELAEMRAQLAATQDRTEAQARRIVELEAERAAPSKAAPPNAAPPNAAEVEPPKRTATDNAGSSRGTSRASAGETPLTNAARPI